MAVFADGSVGALMVGRLIEGSTGPGACVVRVDVRAGVGRAEIAEGACRTSADPATHTVAITTTTTIASTIRSATAKPLPPRRGGCGWPHGAWVAAAGW